ncbi:MAG: gp436 family protein [Paracoccaceae bacterium]
MYATRDDIVRIYGADALDRLTPRDVADPAATVDGALSDASAEIDGYLSTRYDLPLGGTPRVLRRPCIDIATYILANSHARMSTTIENRYKEALDLLKMIARGTAGLGADEPEARIEGSDGGSGSGADFNAQPRRFGRGRT